ncbi:hypothetical protein SLEP1_g44822 [Rubroshorea leprosula]|uniref:Transposase-associated domain-containing protein n=1 Tax=Rubroshorea leprosula TaxID=152421 RepID=A0AAV5LIM8_9ROSI|nr:hypothetical protein SLEP1_g44822 [Rubroshorea leprosula]
MEDRSWMYRRQTPREEIYDEFYNGVEHFVQFAYNSLGLELNDLIKCHCPKCFNLSLMTWGMVWDHLTKNDPRFAVNLGESSHIQDTHHDERIDFHETVYDALFPEDDDNREMEDNFPNQRLDEEPNNQTKAFYDLLHASTIPLGSSKRYETVLN